MTVGEVCLIVFGVVVTIFGIIIPVYGALTRKSSYKEVLFPTYEEYRRGTPVNVKNKDWVQITFKQFLDYYFLNPEHWNVDNLVYKNCIQYHTFSYRQNCYFNYSDYKKFKAWKKQKAKQKKRKEELKIEENNRQRQMAFLEAIQKDINEVRAKAEKERKQFEETARILINNC